MGNCCGSALDPESFDIPNRDFIQSNTQTMQGDYDDINIMSYNLLADGYATD